MIQPTFYPLTSVFLFPSTCYNAVVTLTHMKWQCHMSAPLHISIGSALFLPTVDFILKLNNIILIYHLEDGTGVTSIDMW